MMVVFGINKTLIWVNVVVIAFGMIYSVQWHQNNFMRTNTIQYDAEGRQHGTWEGHWDNGQLRYRLECIHGKKHGPLIEYYPNGNLWYKETFDMGKRIGYRVEYRLDGSPHKRQFYAK
jgi:antitoxin component YwqK of YwqJK toxin-antitoxin module